jgi:predicted secreted protein
LKRTLIAFLVLILSLVPMWALAEDTAADQTDDAYEELGDINTQEIWTVPEDGGLTWDEGSLTIALPEDTSTGYAWSAELDDETVLTQDTDAVGEASDGALPVHTYVYKPAADGTALINLYYAQQKDAEVEDLIASLSYSVTVEGGKITDVAYDDLSAWGEDGDDMGSVLYDGDTGGVELSLPVGMVKVSEEDGVTRLESEDKTNWMTIQYDPDGDPEALLAEFEDADALAKEFSDESKGMSLIDSSVDRESDPPCGILVYEIDTEETVTTVDRIGYQAPNGGILIVESGYVDNGEW